jgi:hypothetical protein
MEYFEKLMDATKRGNLDEVKAVVQRHPEFINKKDALGATALHHATFGGHRGVVEFLVQQGAEINVFDSEFGATPTGWAIEYLREMGGFLGIELDDFGFALRRGDVDWVKRFLKRFPNLREVSDTTGIPFRQLARESGNAEILQLFE